MHDLIQVECYLRSEGVLVRYWYPIDMLERPPAGYRKSPIVGHQALSTANIHLHRYVITNIYLHRWSLQTSTCTGGHYKHPPAQVVITNIHLHGWSLQTSTCTGGHYKHPPAQVVITNIHLHRWSLQTSNCTGGHYKQSPVEVCAVSQCCCFSELLLRECVL